MTAKRLRKQDRTASQSEWIVVCPECGDSFSIAREVPFDNPALAENYGAWLLDQFVWDHIQESEHRGSIRLPSQEELKRCQVQIR
jgi:hypothetical protein